jgi:hypothetical protein
MVRCYTTILTVRARRRYNARVNPSPGRGPFFVADLDVRGELRLLAEYRYEHLEQVPGAAELIGQFSSWLWQSPHEFEGALNELPLALGGAAGAAEPLGLSVRWRSSSDSSGIATVRWREELASLSLFASGKAAEADRLTFAAFQQHLLRELRDTPYEPAFALMDLEQRPLVATFNFTSPPELAPRAVTALADRCFAASYFRYQGLA